MKRQSGHGVKVYNNTVGPDMGWYEKDGKIRTNTTGWIYLEGNISNTVVYNNLLTAKNPSYPANGFVFLKGGQNTKVYNNTIISWGSGIGISAATDGVVNLRNNLMHDISTGITIRLTNTVSHIDYNSYYFSNGVKMATIGDSGTSSFFMILTSGSQRWALTQTALSATSCLTLIINQPATHP